MIYDILICIPKAGVKIYSFFSEMYEEIKIYFTISDKNEI